MKYKAVRSIVLVGILLVLCLRCSYGGAHTEFATKELDNGCGRKMECGGYGEKRQERRGAKRERDDFVGYSDDYRGPKRHPPRHN